MTSSRFAIPLLLLASTGCQSSRWVESASPIDTPVLAVQLERRIVDGAPQEGLFAHPATLDPAAVETRLAELRFRRPRLLHDDRTGSVIPAEQLAPLAKALTGALAAASSSERARFSVGTSAESLFEGRRYTRGVAFVEPVGVLNVAFDWVDELSERDILDERWEDPTRRRSSSVELDLGHAWQMSKEAREDELLWVTTDELTAVAAPVGVSEDEAPASGEVSPPVTEPRDADGAKLTDSERLAQLRLLEKLHAEGVLDDAEFERRRREILDIDR
ncbi:MAG: SHOCT domain-containing protein [Planctomycetota bacterium]